MIAKPRTNSQVCAWTWPSCAPSANKAQSLAHTADSLLKAERAAQDKLTQQVRQLEIDNQALKATWAFLVGLLPTDAAEGVSIRSVQVALQAPGQLRFQLLAMQSGKNIAEIKGRCELTLNGSLEGRTWVLPAAGGSRPLAVSRYARTEGLIEFRRCRGKNRPSADH